MTQKVGWPVLRPFQDWNDRFPYPFHIPQLVRSPPFHISEA